MGQSFFMERLARVFDIGDGSQCDVWCGMDFNTKMLRMDVFGAAGNVTILSPLPPTGQWTHIAATFGNGSAALYVNGKLAQKLPCPVKTADIAANCYRYLHRTLKLGC